MENPFVSVAPQQKVSPASLASGGIENPFASLTPKVSPSPTGATSATGNGYGASSQTDVSGRPLATVPVTIPKTFMSPETTISEVDPTRTAPQFDPTKAQPVTSDVLHNPRMAEATSQSLRQSLGASAYQELDHVMPLELGGSNQKSNLQLETAKDPSKPYGASGNPTPTDALENALGFKVKSGQISLLDAWRQMAQAKGITLKEDSARPGPVDNFLLNTPWLLKPLAGIQEGIEGAGKAIGGFVKSALTKEAPGTAGETLVKDFPELAQTLADIQENPASLGSSLKDILTTPYHDAIQASDAFNTATVNLIKGMKSGAPVAEDIKNSLESVTALAQGALSPITSIFGAASKVPVVGSVFKMMFNVPFALLGDVSGTGGVKVLNSLPISDQAKQTLEPAVRAASSLAGQIVAGRAITLDVMKSLETTFGAKDAHTIVAKAQEMAQEKKSEPDQNPQPSKPEVKPEVNKNVLSELDAAEAGQRIHIDNPVGQDEVRGIQSTFPDWVQPRLRTKELFNKVVRDYEKGIEPKPKTKEAELYDLVGDRAARYRARAHETGGIAEQPKEYTDIERGGYVNPAAVLDDIKAKLAEMKDNRESKKFGETLRTFVVGERDVRVAETNQLRDKFSREVKNPIDQEALTLMRDYKNNPQGLKVLPGDSPKIVKLINRALHPSEEMKSVDEQMTKYFSDRLAEGKKLGFLESSISPDEYIKHLLQPKEAPSMLQKVGQKFFGRTKLSRYFESARARTYPTVLDAIRNGVKPKSLNALDAMTIYGDKHAVNVATRLLISQLKDSDTAKWATKNSPNLPKDWQPIAPESHLFKNEVPFVNKEGGADIAHQALYAPQKVVDALRPITDPDYASRIPFFMSARIYQAYIKSVELGLSFFHMGTLNITELNNTGITDMVRTYGADLADPKFLNAEKEWIRDGLTTPILGRTIEAYQGLKDTSIPSRVDMIRGTPGIKQLDQTARALTYLTFDVMQRKMKVIDASLKDADWLAKHPDASTLEHIAARRSIAKEINGAYGGLNWEIMGTNKSLLSVSKMLLLAPDWTYSNWVTGKMAFAGGLGGSAARRFWISSAVFGVAATQALSVMLSGKPSKDPTSVYLGKDKDGKEIYQNMFFKGAPGDFVNLVKNVHDYGVIQGFAQSLIGKLGPLPKTAIQFLTNRNYLGQTIIPKGMGIIAGTGRSALTLAESLGPIPFSLTNFYQMFTDPNKIYTEKEYWTTLLGGTRPRHVVPSGMREITSGKRKGQLAPALPSGKPLSTSQQIFQGKLTAPKTKR